MNLIVQDKFEKYIKHDLAARISLAAPIDFVIGDVNFIKPGLSPTRKTFLVTNHESVDIKVIDIIRPSYVFKEQELEIDYQCLVLAIDAELLDLAKKQKIQLIKVSTEQKRNELERLNSFLQTESDEKKISLGQFHREEQNKKSKEKKLLYFLDYLNSEYEKSDFILDVLKTIWSDLKKVGTFYRLGFIIQNENHRSYIIEFDGKIDRTKTVPFEKAIQSAQLGQFLANIFKRPVGKLISFSTEKENNQFMFFFEVQGHEFNTLDLDAYMSDRISLLSIVVQRWYSESNEIQILRQWQQLFKSYQNPVHAIDADYNLIQSNYNLQPDDSVKKCYQVLAKHNQPCVGCPIAGDSKLNSKNFKNHVQINKSDYEVIISDFTIDQKKYFFMIYENTNELNLLKSNY